MSSQVPAGDLLHGLHFEQLPENWTPVDAVVLVKCLDEDGSPTWAFRTTDDVNDEELLGALTIRRELQKEKLLSEYTNTDDES
jgi:hypothetical protein